MKLLPSFMRRQNTPEDREGLVDTPEHSDAVDEADEDVLAREGGPRPTERFRRLQRRGSYDK